MRTSPSTTAGLLLYWGFILATAGYTGSAAAQTNASAGDSSRGATTWSQNCGRCHNLRPPTEFRDDLWRSIVTHMRVRAGLTGQQQRDVLAFLQASNNPAPTVIPVATTAITTALPTLSGKQVYDQTCIACHGANGTGALPGVPDLTVKSGPLTQSDEVLIKHITEGFQSSGAAMAMPAKGGNAALTEADIAAVLGYLRVNFGN